MKITHIYHSAFYVELEKNVLLFDWYKGSLPEIPAEKKLYVFCSHAHEDHYSPKIWELSGEHPDLTYILDEGIADGNGHPEAEVIRVRPREEYSAGSAETALRILTLESTDMGVAFYVEAEGKRLYHAGDLNVWFWYDEPMEDNLASEKKCREEMQYLAGRLKGDPRYPDGALLDAAFVPLDFRLQEEAPRCIAAFMDILGAAYVFPMHYWGREEEVKGYLSDQRLCPYAAKLCFDREKTI